MSAFRQHVLRILQEVADLGLAATLIAEAADSLQFNSRRQQASRAAAARWEAQHLAPQDAQHGSQHAPKRAESLPAAKQDARQHAQQPRDLFSGSGPDLGSGSGSPPDLSKPSGKREVSKSDAPEGFEEFWGAYPRKVGKAAARRAWERRKPPLEGVRAALAWQTKSEAWTKDGGLYIPHPTTWLNQERWDDVPLPAGGGRNGSGGRWAAPHPGEFDYPVGEQKL